MLKVLAELERLAGQLDSKQQYKFADEVESIMGTIVSTAQQRLSRDQIPETIPELQAPGDPYTYGYLPDQDAFVVTSPRGLGTVIEGTGPYADSWKKLQLRLPTGHASGPIGAPEESPANPEADYATRALPNYVQQFGAKVRAGEFGPEMRNLATASGVGSVNKLLVGSAGPDDVLSACQKIRAMFQELGKPMPTDRVTLFTTSGTSRREQGTYHGSPHLEGTSKSLTLEGWLAEFERLAGLAKQASDDSEQIQKEASFDLATVMEVAFHSTSSTPFGR